MYKHIYNHDNIFYIKTCTHPIGPISHIFLDNAYHMETAGDSMVIITKLFVVNFSHSRCNCINRVQNAAHFQWCQNYIVCLCSSASPTYHPVSIRSGMIPHRNCARSDHSFRFRLSSRKYSLL